MKYYWIALLLLPTFVVGQEVHYKMEHRSVSDSWVVNPKDLKQDFNVKIERLEPPIPGGDVSMEERRKLHEAVAERYPRKEGYVNPRGGNRNSDTLKVLTKFPANYYYNQNPMPGGTPNDNTLAISDGGNLLTSWNSQLWGYDVNADTYLFAFPFKHPSFFQFLNNYADTLYGTPFPFDPKLMYDSKRDRFILVFLVGGATQSGLGRDPATSETIVCFSSSSDPKDEWYAYQLEGNPLGYETWTDYPQIAINENSFYLTLNQLYPDSGWVEGFAETVMWQMDLDAAFAGDEQVPTKFWTGFEYEGKNIRYLHPIKTGMGPESDTMYFMANRPFTMTNDTFFLVRVVGKATDQSDDIDIQLVPSNLTYGHPPYAYQSSGGQRFWTNDARILGAVRMQNEIQFTGNSIDTNNGLASIYHGTISDLENPVIEGNVISADRELGFPNIAFIGVQASDRETAIFANHTAFNMPAGNSVIYVDNEHSYSEVQTLKRGDTYVNVMQSNEERWGDYTGIQRRFNATSRVWVSGYWGYGSQRPGTWVSELASPKDGPIGIAESEESRLKVFPNPVLETVQFQFELENAVNATFEIYDVQGRFVAQIAKHHLHEGENQISFDASSLQPGAYVVSLKGADGVLWQEKFIRN